MTEYMTVANDEIDKIIFDHYQRYDVLRDVLDCNPGLADYQLKLPAGIIIYLPEFEQQKNKTVNIFD